MEVTEASWHVHLYVSCPFCDHYFDALSEDVDFLDGRYDLEIGQSEYKLNIECPKCEKEFEVITRY